MLPGDTALATTASSRVTSSYAAISRGRTERFREDARLGEMYALCEQLRDELLDQKNLWDIVGPV